MRRRQARDLPRNRAQGATTILPSLTAVALALASACAGGAARAPADCPAVTDIVTLSMKEERGVDTAYDRLRWDDACEASVIAALDDLRRLCPGRTNGTGVCATCCKSGSKFPRC